jgi:ABC-2 type transport system ATP-binding protein
VEGLENLSITIKEVTKEYKGTIGINNITTHFESGILNILIGENGSGKSTLFKCIMGLCHYNGKIVKRKHRIGYAPEEYVMPLHLSVIDFLKSIGRIKGVSTEELDQNVLDYLRFFELEDYKHKPISKLSNGMRQKVNLMQAFIHEPKIIILDEPLAALDKESVPKIVRLIKEKSKTSLVVLSTHQIHHFRTNRKKIFYFKDGEIVDA